MDDYPNLFTVVEVDLTGTYSPSWGTITRRNFYGVSGTPTTWFDGVEERVGAYSDVETQYNWYKQTIESRASVPTDVIIDMSATRTGAQTYEVTSTISIEAGGTGKTMRFYLVDTLDRHPTLQPYYRNGLRQAVETGVDIILAPGQSQVITRTVTLDDTSWSRLEDVTMIAWAQAVNLSGPAEVFNAAQFAIADSESEPGDFNSDGVVDQSDLDLVLLNWGSSSLPTPWVNDLPTFPIGSDPLDHVRQNWGKTTDVQALSAVPEPASAWMIAIGLSGLGIWRRTYHRSRRSL